MTAQQTRLQASTTKIANRIAKLIGVVKVSEKVNNYIDGDVEGQITVVFGDANITTFFLHDLGDRGLQVDATYDKSTVVVGSDDEVVALIEKVVTHDTYSNMAEVVDKILVQFEKTDKLNKVWYHDEQIPQYAHSINGVGDAISCCMTEKDAKRLDSLSQSAMPIDGLTVIGLYNRGGESKDILEKYFKIDEKFLSCLSNIQRMHDTATTYSGFIRKLKEYRAYITYKMA